MQGQNLTLKPFLYIKSSSSYSLHSMHTKNLPQITRIHTDFCYSRTPVNIYWICGRTFISCLKGILPQITRINTDFNCISCICEYLRDLWEIHFYAAEIR